MLRIMHPWQQWPINDNGSWYPNTDVFETDEQIIIRMELAGVEKDQVDITLDDAQLVIHGKRQDPLRAKIRRYYQMEIPYDEFERSVILPEGTQQENINASFEQGLLIIQVHKAIAKEGTHSITIDIE